MLRAESTTMNPHHHGQGLTHLLGRSHHTEVETVLVHHVVFHVTLFWLRRPLGSFLGFEHTRPGFGGLWCLPSQVANGRSRKGNGIITGKVITFEHALHIARFYMGLQQRLGLNSHHAQQSAYHK